jgi:exonuclease VII small subunit
MKERCHDLEEEIARLEAAIADAETALQTYVSAEETKRQSDALNQYRADLGACMAEWEELAQVLESAQ